MDEKEMRAMIRALKLDALETLLDDEPTGNEADAISAWFDVLRKIAIVVECEVGYTHIGREEITIAVKQMGNIKKTWLFLFKGHHGTPGKAIAIIVPLSPEA